MELEKALAREAAAADASPSLFIQQLVRERLAAPQRSFSPAFLALAELHFGAERFGRLKAGLLALGRPIPDFDVAIAATAAVSGLTLVSRDRRFREIDEAPVEDWTAP